MWRAYIGGGRTETCGRAERWAVGKGLGGQRVIKTLDAGPKALGRADGAQKGNGAGKQRGGQNLAANCMTVEI